jgi:hypothetical protein
VETMMFSTAFELRVADAFLWHMALEHHTYSEDDVEEGGIKIKKTNYFFS